MSYYLLTPEVAGSLGRNTEMDTSVHPPIVYKLHYQFDGWSGDELLESFPCYIVSEQIKNKIEAIPSTGCEFDLVEISKSEQFNELYPERVLPKFFWLKITGKASISDFGLSDDYNLVVSQRVFQVLESCNIKNCDVEIYQ